MKKQFDQTVFSKHMFKISLNQGDQILLVEFINDKGFKFIVKEHSKPNEKRFKFISIESPGQVSNEAEVFEHENLANAQNRVQQWAKRIEDDCRIMAPEDSDLESFRKEFFENCNIEITDNSYFSQEEKSTLNKKMQEFETKLQELYEEKHASRQQMNGMHQQIEILKKSIEILDKRTWLSAACNRVIDIVKEVKGAKNEISNLLDGINVSNLLPDHSSEAEESAEEVV